MSARKLGDILREIRAEDTRLAKAGVQAACELLETGRATAGNRERIMAALSYQLGTGDTKLLRWIYKLIALLQNPRYVNYLCRQLHGVDLDVENRLWAYTAIAALTGDHRQLLYDAGDELTVSYSLASGLYRQVDELPDVVRRAAQADDPHAHQFIGLLYGEGRGDIPRELMSELTASPDPASAEYAIWGLRKRGGASWNDVRVDPLSIGRQPANVRRWYYRLVAQHPESRNQLSALVLSWIDTENESLPREGLAFGLHDSPRDLRWDAVLRDWRRTETDPFVRRALGAHAFGPPLAEPPAPSLQREKISRPPHQRGALIVFGQQNYYGPVGIVQGPRGKVKGGVSIGAQGVTGRDLAVVLRSLRDAAAADPAVPPAVVAEVDELVAVATDADTTSPEPKFFTHLSRVTDAIRAVAGLGKAAGDVLDGLGGMGVL